MKMQYKYILVCGSSGFIGGHLVRKLNDQGHCVIGADIEEPKYKNPTYFNQVDLREMDQCELVFEEGIIEEVYNLACLMGGMGYIGSTDHSHDIMTGSTLICANVIECCIRHKVKRLFFSSSACVYNMRKQENLHYCSLKESDAIPAEPDLMYGWQKLMGEFMCQAAYEQYGLQVRIARFHNIFGPEGIWDGGKEKAPAAICRKVAQARDGENISIWGDGKQERSFLYIDECLQGIEKVMEGGYVIPFNVGSNEVVSIETLAKIIISISGKNLGITYEPNQPQGVRARNSDNTLIEKALGWKPTAKLYAGLEKTYNWINEQVNSKT